MESGKGVAAAVSSVLARQVGCRTGRLPPQRALDVAYTELAFCDGFQPGWRPPEALVGHLLLVATGSFLELKWTEASGIVMPQWGFHRLPVR